VHTARPRFPRPLFGHRGAFRRGLRLSRPQGGRNGRRLGADLSGTHVTSRPASRRHRGRRRRRPQPRLVPRPGVARRCLGFDGYHQADGPTSLSASRRSAPASITASLSRPMARSWPGASTTSTRPTSGGPDGSRRDLPRRRPQPRPQGQRHGRRLGYDFLHQTDIPAGLSGVRAIAAGYDFSLALKSDGTVVGWGDDGDGQTNVRSACRVSSRSQPGTTTVSPSSRTARSSAGRELQPHNGRPAGLSGVKAIAAGEEFDLALKSDGTVVAWGWDTYSQTDIPAGLSASSRSPPAATSASP